MEKPNVRFHDGQILSEEPLNKAMEAVDYAVEEAQKVPEAVNAASSAAESASATAASAAAIEAALEAIKGSGDIPAATVAQVAENTADISQLALKVDELCGATIDLSKYQAGQNHIDGTNWFVNAYYLGKIIPCSPNTTFKIKANNTLPALYAFLTDNNVVSGQPAPFATGCSRKMIDSTKDMSDTAPSDAEFLWICTQNGNGKNNTPLSVEIVGKLSELTEKVDDNSKALESVINDISGESTTIDLSKYQTGQYMIDGGKWLVNAYYLAKFVPCVPNKQYKIKANANKKAIITFLTNNSVVNDQPAPFANGWNNTESIDPNGEVTKVAPANAAYLWIATQFGTGNDNTPSLVAETTEGIKQQVKELEQAISGETSDVSKTLRLFPNAQLPCVNFQFDDISPRDEQIVSLFEEYGLTCGFAFIASEDKIAKYGKKYLALNKNGFSILSHSVDSTAFNTTNYTYESARTAIATAKSNLEKVGFVVNGWVSPSSVFTVAWIDLIKKFHAYGFTYQEGVGRASNPCTKIRKSMETLSLEQCKAEVDNAISSSSCLSFYGHSDNLTIGTFNIAKIREIIEYCIAKRDAGLLFIGSPDECAKYYYDSIK